MLMNIDAALHITVAEHATTSGGRTRGLARTVLFWPARIMRRMRARHVAALALQSAGSSEYRDLITIGGCLPPQRITPMSAGPPNASLQWASSARARCARTLLAASVGGAWSAHSTTQTDPQ